MALQCTAIRTLAGRRLAGSVSMLLASRAMAPRAMAPRAALLRLASSVAANDIQFKSLVEMQRAAVSRFGPLKLFGTKLEHEKPFQWQSYVRLLRFLAFSCFQYRVPLTPNLLHAIPIGRYKQFGELVDATRSGLAQLGVGPNDKVSAKSSPVANCDKNRGSSSAA